MDNTQAFYRKTTGVHPVATENPFIAMTRVADKGELVSEDQFLYEDGSFTFGPCPEPREFSFITEAVSNSSGQKPKGLGPHSFIYVDSL